MLPQPLHPAVVHFPIVLAVLLPPAALAALLAIRRGTSFRAVWAIPLVLAAGLALSSWVAVESGESEEDRVEAVVARNAIHEHEERAEQFIVFSAVLLAVTGAGMLGGAPGRAARLVAAIATLALLPLGWRVGASGGELVYTHGAASAYVEAPAGASAGPREGAAWSRSDREGEHPEMR